MTRHLIRQGEGPANAYLRKHNELIKRRQKLEQLLEAAAENAPDLNSHQLRRAGATASGDELRLRGIPCIARGVQGATDGTPVPEDQRSSPFRRPGTRPGANLK